MKSKQVCPVDGCESIVRCGGYCGKHYMRFRRYGDVNYITPELVRRENNRTAQKKSRTTSKNTYIKMMGRHEHRVVMERKIGRPMVRGEVVHHIDGNKHNNSLENLQLMTQSDHIKEHLPEMIRIRKSRLVEKTHCPSGHPYSGLNLRIVKNGAKVCVTCSRAAFHKWKNKNA